MVDPALILWFDFEEEATAVAGAVDKSGNLLDGICQTCPSQTAGPMGRGLAIQFDDPAQFISVDDAPQLELSDEITFAAWVRLDGTPADPFTVVFSRELGNEVINAWDMHYHEPSSGFRVGLQGVYSPPSVDVGVGEWAHIAATWSAADTTLRAYVNGVPLAPTTAEDAPLYTDTRFTIGADRRGTVNLAFLGSVDDLRVYSRVLTPDEIAALAS